MPDAAVPDITQAPAESAAPAATPAPSSAPAASSSTPQLASFGDALKAASEKPDAATPREQEPSKATDSDTDGHTAAQAKQPASTSQPAPAPAPSADSAGAEPTGDEPEVPGDQAPEQARSTERPSRRGAAEIKTLTAERDALLSEVTSLRTAVTIPPAVQATIAARLPDEEFNALEARLKREDLTGEYLTAEERERYTKALQIRDLSLPLYQHARAEAKQWADGQQQAVIKDAADQLAPVLRERPHLSPDAIGRAESWRAVYEHIADTSLAEGEKRKAAEMQPKLDEATARIADLEMELAPLRIGRTGRPLERDGVSGGAVTTRPDFRTASASDLFAAGMQQRGRERNGRYASSGNGRA